MQWRKQRKYSCLQILLRLILSWQECQDMVLWVIELCAVFCTRAVWAFSESCSWTKLLLHFFTAPLLKKQRSWWGNEASHLRLFQILCEVIDSYDNSALVGLMVHHWAETGTKKNLCANTAWVRWKITGLGYFCRWWWMLWTSLKKDIVNFKKITSIEGETRESSK